MDDVPVMVRRIYAGNVYPHHVPGNDAIIRVDVAPKGIPT